MKTRCPNCQTIFRITTKHLKARSGNVRCGQCKTVFNALDALIDERKARSSVPSTTSQDKTQEKPETITPESDVKKESSPTGSVNSDDKPIAEEGTASLEQGSDQQPEQEEEPIAEAPPPWQDMTGYMEKPVLSHRARTLYWVGTVVLAFALVIQLVFYLRSEIAISKPKLRPYLNKLSVAVGSKLAFPRHSELISIETSDLHKDPSDNDLLILSATLRNRAQYTQELPVVELSLTDVQESVIARKILTPEDYLPSDMSAKRLFEANADIPIKLWIDAKALDPAGYRLYIFYP